MWPWSELAKLKRLRRDALNQAMRALDQRDAAWVKYDKLAEEADALDLTTQALHDDLGNAYARIRELEAQIAKFDHDGDGSPGCSKPKAKRSV